MARSSLRNYLSTAGLLAAGGYLLYSVLGPGGVPRVIEKHRQIQELQRQNLELEREIRERRERIRSLSENPSEQEREVREQLRLLKKNETTFIIPNAP
jgi:cell division protein FtsB